MPLSNKQFDLIEEADLQALVDNQVPEGKTIDYKESLPGKSDSEKKEFLADVSSFANAAGGYLIYGMKEESGVASELCGLQGINADAEINRLENIIRDCIDPRIPGVSTRSVELQGSKVAIIIRIPKSWASPHMVAFKRRHTRFYSRHSVGKYPLDVSELRAAFALSETTMERIRNFRAERLSRIVAGETPAALDEEAPKIVLHIIPLRAFDPAARFDVASLAPDRGFSHPPYPTYTALQIFNSLQSLNHRHNFDGFLTYSDRSYLQVFRNGSIECARACINWKDERIISGKDERKLFHQLPRILDIQKQLGVEPPLFIMLSLLGVSGYKVLTESYQMYPPIDRNSLLIPEVIVETFKIDFDGLAELMRPVFDAVWNAAGWPRSMNYDETGKWVGQRG